MHVHYFHGIHQANVLWPTGSEGAFLASRIAIMVMHVTNASSCMCIVQAMCDIYLLGSIWLVPKQVVMLACAFMTYMCIHELAGAYYHFIIFLVPRPIPLAMADSSFRNVRPRLLDRASASQDEIGGHHCIVLQGQDFQPYPVDEMHCFIGIYHKIQFLNGKSMWKSQEIGGKSPWSPKQTAYLWWSCVYKMYFLSRKPLVERDHDFNFQDWDSLKIVASFSEDLQVAYLPWNAYEECCLVRWMSFFDWAHEIMLQETEEDPAEAAPASATIGAVAKSFPPLPPNMVGTANYGPICRPPPAVQPELPSIRKKGYMCKLVSYMVSDDMNLPQKKALTKACIMESPIFKAVYLDHKQQLERYGEDPRFNYAPSTSSGSMAPPEPTGAPSGMP